MIELFTGLPGSGKTAELVRHLLSKADDQSRPIYACGVNGFADPRIIPLSSPDIWESLPDGSIVVIDEVQIWWPSNRGTGEVPSFLKNLSTHRHRGFDFILTTQRPTYVNKYVRGLVERHSHFVRKYGTMIGKRYTWDDGCKDDPNLKTARSVALVSPYKIPSIGFGHYKSSTLHTVKPRVPKIAWVIPGFLVFLAVAAWALPAIMREGSQKAVTAIPVSAPAESLPHSNSVDSSVPVSSSVRSREKKPMTLEEWELQWTPRVEGIPWSAPIFDDKMPTGPTKPLCIENLDANTCRCYTTQATRMKVSLKFCRTAVRDGVYDPFARG